MSYYEVEIEGKYKIDEIQSQITDEELGFSEFKSSRLSGTGNRATNIVTFMETDLRPKQLQLVKQGAPQPPGTKLVWYGEMVVEEKITPVTAYRTA